MLAVRDGDAASTVEVRVDFRLARSMSW